MKHILKNSILSAGLIATSIITALPVFSQSYDEVPADLSTEISHDVSPDFISHGHYQGFADASFTFGVTRYRADMLSLSTSQGYRFNEWFYLGAGTGIDFLFSHKSDSWGKGWENAPGFDTGHPSASSVVMLPLFADFRFLVGNKGKKCSFFLDLRAGAEFKLSNKYIAVRDGFITDHTFFYLNPSIGVNIPVCSKYPNRAIDIAVNYRLLTSSYWNVRAENITLQLLGLTVGYEW